ncbi:MAG TPA: hypothetical protein DEP65_13960 [Ruminococcus sp.]|nr:hypothetical protein [Ruminococcus sp.]
MYIVITEAYHDGDQASFFIILYNEAKKLILLFEKLIVLTVSFFFYTQNLKGGGRCVEKDE